MPLSLRKNNIKINELEHRLNQRELLQRESLKSDESGAQYRKHIQSLENEIKVMKREHAEKISQVLILY